MKRKVSGLSICVFISLFLITCSNFINPFLNKSDSMAKIVSRNNLNSDTVEIFSTQNLLVNVYLKEHIDSIRVHIDNNRLQPVSDSVVKQIGISNELSFQYSFFKTGKQNIRLVSYVNNGDTIVDSCSLYAVSPLRQNSVSGRAGDSIFLSTAPVDDQVMYVWDLHNGIVIKETESFAGIKLTTDFTSRSGELYVEDLSQHRSPSYIFQINSVIDTQSQMYISCLHDSIFGDSVYTRTSQFKFTVVVSGAKQLTGARVNGIPFDDSLKAGESFVLSYDLFDLDTIKLPVKMDVRITDNNGYTALKTWFVHFIKNDPSITLYMPVGNNTTTASASADVRGTILNIQQYNNLYLLILKNGKAVDSTIITPKKTSFSFKVQLVDYTNRITLELYADSSMIGSKIDVSDFFIYYNPAYIDTIPPQIRSIRCNNQIIVDSMISRTDTIMFSIDAVDNSNSLTVYVNGKPAGKDSNSLFFSAGVIIPRTKISTLFQIKATDSSGFAVYDSVYVKYNRPPQWIKTPSYATVVTAGEECVFDIQVSDPDADSLFVTMIIEKQSGNILLDATSGHVVWHPQFTDSGQYKVTLNATDRTEDIDTGFTLIVKGKGAVPVQLLKNSINFPDTVIVGESLHVVLKTAPQTGTKPFVFSASFIDDRPGTILNATDSVINWTPSDTETGLRILRVKVTDGLNFKDSMDVHFRVMKKVLACFRWKQNTDQYREGEVLGAAASIVLDKPLSFKVTVPYIITFPNGANAASDADIRTPLSGNITFKPGDTVASLAILIVDDQMPEYIERFEIKITGNDSIKVCDQCNPVFPAEIIDNDLVTFDFVETQAEGLEGQKDLLAIVKLSKALQTELVLYYDVDWSETNADTVTDYIFNRAECKLTIAPGITREQIRMEILDDNNPEENEKITIRLRSEVEFAKPKDSAKFVYTIMNDDTPVQYSFTGAEVTWPERDTQMTVLVRLDRKSDSVITVVYSIDPDPLKTNAKVNSDFRIADPTDSIIFYPGEISKAITIQIFDDTIPEMVNEFFTIELQSINNNVNQGQFVRCKFIIESNEVGAFFASQSQSGDEEYERHPYCKIMLTKATDVPITVTFSNANSTADYRTDYTMAAPDHDHITFNTGEIEKDVGITIVDDERNENTEYIRLKITGVSDPKRAYILEEKKSTVITINNN